MQAQGSSDAGQVREDNQDVFAVREDLGLAVLADGMGGTRAGGVAAELAVEAALDHLASARRRGPLTPDQLSAAIKQANSRVIGTANAISSYRGMGTTLVVTAVTDGQGYLAHVGDSRAYRFRAGELSQLTKDHSLVQEWVDAGVLTPAEAENAPNRHVITRAIGAKRSVEPDVQPLELGVEDLILLCSDGLSGMLADAEIAQLLTDAAGGEAGPALAGTASELVDAANRAGGMDNVTVVLISR